MLRIGSRARDEAGFLPDWFDRWYSSNSFQMESGEMILAHGSRSGSSPLNQDRGHTEEVTMYRMARLVLLLPLVLGLSGCGKSKPIHYYTVQLPEAPTLAASTHPVSLLVGTIGGGPLYR